MCIQQQLRAVQYRLLRSGYVLYQDWSSRYIVNCRRGLGRKVQDEFLVHEAVFVSHLYPFGLCSVHHTPATLPANTDVSTCALTATNQLAPGGTCAIACTQGYTVRTVCFYAANLLCAPLRHC